MKCSQCGSKELAEGDLESYTDLHMFKPKDKAVMKKMADKYPDTYLCLNCGHIDQYIRLVSKSK